MGRGGRRERLEAGFQQHLVKPAPPTPCWMRSTGACRTSRIRRTTRPLLLGCIADDFTGATDLANNLVRAGMKVVQTIGVPRGPVEGVDAVVVALKSRTIPRPRPSRNRWPRCAGCASRAAASSTSRSAPPSTPTPQGNIGPVAEALLQALGADFCCVTPAFPENARTVYQGLPVRGRGAAERIGHAQPSAHAHDRCQPGARDAGAVGRARGADPARGGARRQRGDPARIAKLRADGVRFGIVDAVANEDLLALGARSPTRRWWWPAPASPSACRATTASPPAAAALPPARGARHRVGQLLAGHAAAGGRVPAQRRRPT